MRLASDSRATHAVAVANRTRWPARQARIDTASRDASCRPSERPKHAATESHKRNAKCDEDSVMGLRNISSPAAPSARPKPGHPKRLPGFDGLS
jgi:hypothetical protein